MKHYSQLFLLSGVLLLAACTKGGSGSPVALSDTHIHGLAVDRGDSSRVYIATHDGLFQLTNDKDLTLVGGVRDDYMGFSPHPTDGKVIYSSGHPSGGGNLGVQESTDAGLTWQKLSDGDPDGPVDFHAMTVDEANDSLIYGWYRGKLHRSEDRGKTWKIIAAMNPVASFASDPNDDRVLYVGSTQGGVLKSTDRGETWTSLSPMFENDSIIDIEVDPKNNGLLIATEKQGIVRASPSPEGGMTFEQVGTFPNGSVPSQIALDRQNPEVLYAAVNHEIYKSLDGGKTWQKIL